MPAMPTAYLQYWDRQGKLLKGLGICVHQGHDAKFRSAEMESNDFHFPSAGDGLSHPWPPHFICPISCFKGVIRLSPSSTGIQHPPRHWLPSRFGLSQLPPHTAQLKALICLHSLNLCINWSRGQETCMGRAQVDETLFMIA